MLISSELEEFKAQAEVEEQNKNLVRRYLEEIDKGNIDIIDKVYSPDCRIYFPGNFEPLSREEMKERITSFFKHFENITHKIEDMIAEGDKVLARNTASAAQTGWFKEVAPSGKNYKIGQLLLYRISEGKIAEYWIQEDFLWMNRQLGLELRPKEKD